MSIALHIGSASLSTLQNDSNQKLTSRSIETAYTVMDDTQENRMLLQKIAIPFLCCEDSLIVPGEEAKKIARFSNRPLYPLFSKGELVLNDPVHRQLLSTLIQATLPKTKKNNEYCAFITPGIESASSLEKLVSQIVTLQGFKPLATTITLAAGLSAFSVHSRFSGYVVYLGHSHSEIGLIHQSRVVIRHATPYGSEWMDEQLATSCKFLTTNSEGQQVPNIGLAKAMRLKPEINVSPYLSSNSQITGWYESLFDSLLDHFTSQIEVMREYIDTLETLPVVYLGELSHVEGFQDLLTQNLNSRNIRFDTQRMTHIKDEHFPISQGALVTAAMEEEAVFRAAS